MVVDEHPQEKEKYHQLKDTINIYNDYSSLNMVCYSCGSKSHLVKNCEVIHYVVNKEKCLTSYRTRKTHFQKSFVRRRNRGTKAVNRLETMMQSANKIQEKIFQGKIEIEKFLKADYMQDDNSQDYSRVSHINRLFSMDRTALRER
mmetsp:Transcript_12944/g.11072  ORF Transcript_12944/g.11072 Transcript_12944/m.11072 type:complete len:146 (-) Transcript_12944:1217-1654(-)